MGAARPRPPGGRSAVFAPLPRSGRADAVVRRLSDGIRLGLLRADEQLPSESDLAARFDVSPVTVREALTALREEGLIVTRRGRNGGSFVTRDPERGADEAVRDRLRAISPAELRDLADHYVAISGMCALLAADRAGRQDLGLLADTLTDLERAPDPAGRRRAGSRFQVELAAAAQSPRLTRVVLTLQADVGPLLWAPLSTDAARDQLLDQHRAVFDALRARDDERARRQTAALVYAALARASALQLALWADDEAEATGVAEEEP